MNLVRFTTLCAVALLAAFTVAPTMAQKATTKPASKAAKATKAKAKTVQPATKKTTAKTAKTKSNAKTAAKKTSKAPSPCKGLKQTACKANSICGWIVPKKKVSSSGRKLTPYCRKVAGIAKKKK